MERIINAQVGAQQQVQQFSERVLEINPRHPIIVRLKELYEAEAPEDDDEGAAAADSPAAHMALTVYEAALLESGFGVDVVDFNLNVHRLLRQSMGVAADAGLLPEDEVEEDDEEGEDEDPEPLDMDGDFGNIFTDIGSMDNLIDMEVVDGEEFDEYEGSASVEL